MKHRGYECIACAAHRLHRIVALHDTRSKTSRLARYRICTVCETKTPLAEMEQPGVCCPKCLEIRCPTEYSCAEFRRRQVRDGNLIVVVWVPVRRRSRRCRNPKCRHAFTEISLNARNFC